MASELKGTSSVTGKAVLVALNQGKCSWDRTKKYTFSNYYYSDSVVNAPDESESHPSDSNAVFRSEVGRSL